MSEEVFDCVYNLWTGFDGIVTCNAGFLKCNEMSCPAYTPRPKKKPQTNYDRLISKTPEQLADWLADILNHCENKKPEEPCRMSCPLYKCCNYQPSDNIEDWLKSPVEVET